MTIKIDRRAIGQDHPPYIIGEMSGNHNQSIEKALKLIDAAADAGVDAIKLQTYTADTLTIDCDSADFRVENVNGDWDGKTLYELYEIAHTPWEWHEKLFAHAKSKGITIFSTPFDDGAIELLESLNAPAYKIASFENNHLPLIKSVAKTGKPLIISTGASTLSDIQDAVVTAREAGCDDLIILKCTSTYPASPKDSNVRTIPHMRETFNCEVGLSDHTLGIGVPIAATALGATVIEKHFCLDRSEGGVDAAFSLEPHELKQLVDETKRAWQSLGAVKYNISNSEKSSKSFKRSIYVVKDVAEGEVITAEHVRIIRPGYGLKPKYMEQVIGRIAAKGIKRGQRLQWDDFV